jgi:predicted RNase H-like HicB family nuclease
MEKENMNKQYTVLIRKSKLEYVAICLELNVSARGVDLYETEENLKNAIEIYLEDCKENPATVVTPISTEELIEFLRDTEPQWLKKNKILKSLEVHEVPSYV